MPAIADSPMSSAPSTPNDEAQGHRRTGSVSIGSEDYFMSALRLRQDSKSAPGTPQGSKRNATFSPRLIFHDTWPSQEYDRRGDIATCNRLTPMLAQQIKEELNTLKMVSCICKRVDIDTNPRRKWRSTRTPRSTHTFSDRIGSCITLPLAFGQHCTVSALISSCHWNLDQQSHLLNLDGPDERSRGRATGEAAARGLNHGRHNSDVLLCL